MRARILAGSILSAFPVFENSVPDDSRPKSWTLASHLPDAIFIIDIFNIWDICDAGRLEYRSLEGAGS